MEVHIMIMLGRDQDLISPNFEFSSNFPANFQIIKIIININQNLWTEKLLKICLITFLLHQIDQLPTYVY
jgi:hypothetical protein